MIHRTMIHRTMIKTMIKTMNHIDLDKNLSKILYICDSEQYFRIYMNY